MINLEGMTKDLERIAIDPGTSFLGGGATSLFTGSGVTIGRVTNPFLPLTQMPSPITLATEVANTIISDVTSFAASYFGQKIGELLTPPSIGDIMAAGQSYLGQYIKSPKEILIDLVKKAESEVGNKEQEDLKKELGELQSNINKKVGDIKEKVNKVIKDLCPKWAREIIPYITQGPKWVKSQAYMIDKRCCEQIEKQIAEQTDKLKAKKQSVINGLGEGYAKKAAAFINEKIYDKTYQKLKKVLQLRAKAKNLAASAVKKAVLQLKAMLGQ